MYNNFHSEILQTINSLKILMVLSLISSIHYHSLLLHHFHLISTNYFGQRVTHNVLSM